ncbi:YkgJ family cysteine cluster protein [Methanolobus profundi]|uniref:Uncharacterized protein n=1 Tax=Methanolobus profundi TaxID=487685 RepID=A0A1I4SZC3_9EURY|nr:YkgJ family cysteine cluster protein [Methanolobus profundi]SFM69739.1 hypothetical protein SAMN04488696_2093 [Methanolobus profundi]
MNVKFKEILINELEEEIKAAKLIDPQELAKQIKEIGFKCIMCGKCCRREFGDNRVVVIPDEIHRIQNNSDLEWNDIAEPLNIEADTPEEECYLQAGSGMIDEYGNIHTFGWMLHRKENRDCSFIPDEVKNNRCNIYELRPLLCSTYPFYMEDLKLQTSECEGLGENISEHDSKKLSEMLINRYLGELQDTILTYRNYEGFETDEKSREKAMSNLKQGYLNYVVHNSEGTCKITKNI